MVRGLEIFGAHFRDHRHQYALIGGTACSLIMETAGLGFRATKDLDIVLCLECMDCDFVRTFWEFIESGGYQNQQASTAQRVFYRFYGPRDESYPAMLELFSRMPDALKYSGQSHLTPIPMEDDISSLSAILMSDQYYRLVRDGRTDVGGISVVRPEYLIPLKARAWLDLTARREFGEAVDARDIRKQRNDVFRLYRVISPQSRVSLSGTVQQDLQSFLEPLLQTQDLNLKSLGLQDIVIETIVNELAAVYGLSWP